VLITLTAFPPFFLLVVEGDGAFAVIDPAVLVARVLLDADEELDVLPTAEESVL